MTLFRHMSHDVWIDIWCELSLFKIRKFNFLSEQKILKIYDSVISYYLKVTFLDGNNDTVFI